METFVTLIFSALGLLFGHWKFILPAALVVGGSAYFTGYWGHLVMIVTPALGVVVVVSTNPRLPLQYLAVAIAITCIGYLLWRTGKMLHKKRE